MRVVEFGGPAAAWCGRLFVLSGDDVIRVDLPDVSLDRDHAIARDVFLNAGKTRVGIDYRTREGRELLSDIADKCDVLVCDAYPAELDTLDWLTLGDEKPGLIRVSISPFGLSGPYRDWRATGPVLLAMGGYTHIIGDPDREPLSLPGHYVEYQSGQFAFAAAGALSLSKQADVSRVVEVSMLETVLSLSQFTTVMWTCNGQVRQRCGNAWSNLHPIAMYPCRDGWFLVNVVPGFWPAFTKMLGREDLLQDPRFATNQARVANRDELDRIIVDRLSGYSMAELMEMGQRQFRVPTGGAYELKDVLEHEHLDARHFFRPVKFEDGTLKVPGSVGRPIHGGRESPLVWEHPGEFGGAQ